VGRRRSCGRGLRFWHSTWGCEFGSLPALCPRGSGAAAGGPRRGLMLSVSVLRCREALRVAFRGGALAAKLTARLQRSVQTIAASQWLIDELRVFALAGPAPLRRRLGTEIAPAGDPLPLPALRLIDEELPRVPLRHSREGGNPELPTFSAALVRALCVPPPQPSPGGGGSRRDSAHSFLSPPPPGEG